jgi:DNA-binding CsgD family transcriptional regulator
VRDNLRPLERCVLAMRDDGLSTDEISRRIKRSPGHVERIIAWTELPSRRSAPRVAAKAFERRVLALRARGESYEQIGGRFRRSPGFIRRVEGLAHYRLALELLT